MSRGVGLAVGAILGVIAIASFTGGSDAPIVQSTLLLAALGISFQIVYTLLGQLSLGHSALFGAGAYVYAYATLHGVGVLVAAIMGIAAGGLTGVLVGLLTMRLAGVSFAAVTYAFVSIASVVVSGSNTLGSTSGLVGVPRFPELASFTSLGSQIIFAGVLLVLVGGIFIALRLSLPGLTLEMVRGDRQLAAAHGVNTLALSVAVMTLSGLLAGLVGVVFAQNAQFVSPDVFGLYYVVTPLSIVVVGGTRHAWGVLPGCVIVVLVPQLLNLSPEAEQIVSALLLIGVLLLFPGGLAEAATRWGRRLGLGDRRGRDVDVSLDSGASRP